MCEGRCQIMMLVSKECECAAGYSYSDMVRLLGPFAMLLGEATEQSSESCTSQTDFVMV